MTTFRKLTADQTRRVLRVCQVHDYEMRLRRYPAVLEVEREEEPVHERDAEEFFLAEQMPADSNFR